MGYGLVSQICVTSLSTPQGLWSHACCPHTSRKITAGCRLLLALHGRLCHPDWAGKVCLGEIAIRGHPVAMASASSHHLSPFSQMYVLSIYFFQDDGFSIIICFLICLLSLALMKVIFLFRSISFRQMPSLRVLAMPLSHTAYTSILFTSSCYSAHVTKRELHRDPLRFFFHT